MEHVDVPADCAVFGECSWCAHQCFVLGSQHCRHPDVRRHCGHRIAFTAAMRAVDAPCGPRASLHERAR